MQAQGKKNAALAFTITGCWSLRCAPPVRRFCIHLAHNHLTWFPLSQILYPSGTKGEQIKQKAICGTSYSLGTWSLMLSMIEWEEKSLTSSGWEPKWIEVSFFLSFVLFLSLHTKHFSGNVHFPSGNPNPEAAKIAFLSLVGLLECSFLRRTFKQKAMLVNGMRLSFQRKIRLQTFFEVGNEMILWPFHFSVENKTKNRS